MPAIADCRSNDRSKREGSRNPQRGDTAMRFNAQRYLRYLIIIIIGNALYFLSMPYLPPAARHQRFQLDLGTVVDFWFCLVVFGIFELVRFLRSRGKSDKSSH
jgi:hypothetical protein